MIRLDEAVIVEGKYDKIKLSSMLDAVIIVTNGFGIFKDAEKLELIRYYARTKGIIILTDSDSAGRRIRGYIKGAVGKIVPRADGTLDPGALEMEEHKQY